MLLEIFSEKLIKRALLILFAANVFIWQAIIFAADNRQTEFYFLDVGQGDSQLVVLPSNVKVMIDGGPNAKVLGALARVLPVHDRYIDLLIVSHPEVDHFAGFIDVLKNYQVGAVIDNGRRGTAKSYPDFEKAILASDTKHIILKEDDAIRYQDKKFEILSPSPAELKSKKLNDTSLVIMFKDGNLKVLYTGDIGFNVENRLLKKYQDLSASVLKVPHHGSKYSSGLNLLRAVSPKMAAIGVGKNSYGHPTQQVLQRLASVAAQVYRTDIDGNVRLVFDGRDLAVSKTK